MKQTLIYSQVTAVLEKDFLHRLSLGSNINEVQKKLLAEVSQTCVIHTENADSWILQGFLEDINKAHQLFKAIDNFIYPLKSDKTTEIKHVKHTAKDTTLKKDSAEFKLPIISGDDDFFMGHERMGREFSSPRNDSPVQNVLPHEEREDTMKFTSDHRQKKKKKKKRTGMADMPKEESKPDSMKMFVAENAAKQNTTHQYCVEGKTNSEKFDRPQDCMLSNGTFNLNETSELITESKFKNTDISTLCDPNTSSYEPQNNKYQDTRDSIDQCENIGLPKNENQQTPEENSGNESELCDDLVGGDLRKERMKDECVNQPEPALSTKLGCDLCGKVFTTTSNLGKHLKSAHLGIRFQCGFGACKKSFTDKSTLLRHCRKAHEGLQCEKCRMLCHSEQQLNEHTQNCKEGPFQAICLFCGKAYTSVSNLNKHVKFSHSGEKITCDLCNKHYKTPSSLRDHRENQHHLFDCTRCNMKDMQHTEFESHMMSAHGNPFNVVNLGHGEAVEQVKKTAVYVRQKRTRHSAECPHCKKMFSSMSNMKHHMRRVHEKLKEICSKCGQSFSTHDHLKTHVKLAHETITYSCPMCDETYTNRLTLSKHQAAEHRQLAMDLTSQCEVCGRAFLYKCNLDRHIRTEHQKIRYPCDECGREFSTKHARSSHVKSQHQGQRWLCEHCPRNFKLKHKLYEHVMVKHKNNSHHATIEKPESTSTDCMTETQKGDLCVSLQKKPILLNIPNVSVALRNLQTPEKTTDMNNYQIPEKMVGLNNLQIPENSTAENENRISTEENTVEQSCGFSNSKPDESFPVGDHTTDADLQLLQASAGMGLCEHFVSSEVGFDCHTATTLLNLVRSDPEDILKSALETHGIVPRVTTPVPPPTEEHFTPLDFHSALNLSVGQPQDLQLSIQDQMESPVYAIVSPEPPTTTNSVMSDMSYAAFANPVVFSKEFL